MKLSGVNKSSSTYKTYISEFWRRLFSSFPLVLYPHRCNSDVASHCRHANCASSCVQLMFLLNVFSASSLYVPTGTILFQKAYISMFSSREHSFRHCYILLITYSLRLQIGVGVGKILCTPAPTSTPAKTVDSDQLQFPFWLALRSPA